jgi:hypothetical protein
MRTILCGVIAALTLMGCSKPATGDAPPAVAGAAASAAAPPAKDDACALLSLSEIRRVLPQAARAERDDALKEHGINGCDWYADTGKAPVLEVSVWTVSGDDDTPTSNARTLAMGIADPTRANTEAAVRLEKVAGVGEEAVAIVEKRDDARGILTTAGLLTLRQNGRIATVASAYIAVEDRSKALGQLAALGKAVAAQL